MTVDKDENVYDGVEDEPEDNVVVDEQLDDADIRSGAIPDKAPKEEKK